MLIATLGLGREPVYGDDVTHPADPTTSLGQPPVSDIQRAYLDRLSPYLPTYFIYAPKVPEAKFQYSLKYRVLGVPGEPHRNGLYLGYTQLSLWNLGQPSNPFFDTSYMPELFWESLEPAESSKGGGAHWRGFQAGAEHESNGLPAGPDKRSLNIVYVRPIVYFGALNGWNLVLAPKLLSYLPGLADNRDIPRYRGYAEWTAVVGDNNGPALLVIDRTGSHFDRNSVEVNLTVPVRIRMLDFATFFIVQWFQGYGESIRDYNHSTTALRAGIALVR
jgi:outer membrane phospholipase A